IDRVSIRRVPGVALLHVRVRRALAPSRAALYVSAIARETAARSIRLRRLTSCGEVASYARQQPPLHVSGHAELFLEPCFLETFDHTARVVDPFVPNDLSIRGRQKQDQPVLHRSAGWGMAEPAEAIDAAERAEDGDPIAVHEDVRDVDVDVGERREDPLTCGDDLRSASNLAEDRTHGHRVSGVELFEPREIPARRRRADRGRGRTPLRESCTPQLSSSRTASGP